MKEDGLVDVHDGMKENVPKNVPEFVQRVIDETKTLDMDSPIIKGIISEAWGKIYTYLF